MRSREFQRESSVLKVSGGSPENEEEIREMFAEYFRDQPLKSFERRKTPQEEELIREVSRNVAGLVRRYGGNHLDIRPEHIHILDEEKVRKLPEDIQKRLIAGGRAHFVPELQEIIAHPKNEDWGPFGEVGKAEVIGHEMFHFNSYFSAVEKDDQKIKFRRGGWVMLGEKYGDPFSDIDEAVVQELTHRLSRDYLKNISVIREDYQRREERIKRMFGSREAYFQNPVHVTIKQLADDKFEAELSAYPYFEQRKKLQKIIRDIRQAMPETYQSDEEVFEKFARALFTGDILDVARMIKQAYGRGAFRQLGQETAGSKKG